MKLLLSCLGQCSPLVLLLGLGFLPNPLLAHALGEDYIVVSFLEDSIEGHFEIHFDDLRDKLGLDLPMKKKGAAAAIAISAPQVHEYLRSNFSIGPAGGEPYEIEFTGQDLTNLPQGIYAKYMFRAESGPIPDRLEIRHDMLFEDDPFHRGLLLVEYKRQVGAGVWTRVHGDGLWSHK